MSPQKWRDEWFYEHRFENDGWIPTTEGIRTTAWKYTRYPTTETRFEECFDLLRDPKEKHNLAPSSQQTAALSRRTDLWKKTLDAWSGTSAWQEPAPASTT
jgi:arylsulfatase A-like enzyme